MTPLEAVLASMVLHTLMYGVYAVLFVASVYLPFMRKDRPPHKGVLAVTFMLFLFITTHWILHMTIICDTFIYGKRSVAADPKNLAKTVLFVLTIFVGDMRMVYRLFGIWNWNKFIPIIPAFLSCVLLACGGLVVRTLSQSTDAQAPLTSINWVLYTFILSIATNLYVMVLVTYRILTVHSRLPKDVKVIARSLWFILEIILESAGIYILFLIITLSGHLAQQSYELITLDALIPCIGIAFTLIIVRARLELATPSKVAATKTTIQMRSRRQVNSMANFQVPQDFLQVVVENEVITRFDSRPASELDEFFAKQKVGFGLGRQKKDDIETGQV